MRGAAGVLGLVACVLWGCSSDEVFLRVPGAGSALLATPMASGSTRFFAVEGNSEGQAQRVELPLGEGDMLLAIVYESAPLRQLRLEPGSFFGPGPGDPARPLPPGYAAYQKSPEGAWTELDEETLHLQLGRYPLSDLDPNACDAAGGCYHWSAEYRHAWCHVPCRTVTLPEPPDQPAPPSFEPCPAGWHSKDVGVSVCKPPERIMCADGEVQFIGEAECRPPRPTCGPSHWPSGLPATGRTVYVDASSRPLGDGSLASPFRTIAEALAEPNRPLTVAVAAGTYDEPVTLRGDVTLIGCGWETRLSSSGGIVVNNRGLRNRVEGMTIFGGSAGILVVTGDLTLHGVEILASHAGVIVNRQGALNAEDLYVHGVRDVGIQASSSSVALSNVVIHSMWKGVSGESGATLDLSQLFIGDVDYGVVAVTSSLSLERALLTGVSGIGVWAKSGGKASLSDLVVLGSGQVGAGVGVQSSSASIEVHRVLFEDEGHAGIVDFESDDALFQDVVVLSKDIGIGIHGGSAEIERAFLRQNGAVGVTAIDGTVELRDMTVHEVILRQGAFGPAAAINVKRGELWITRASIVDADVGIVFGDASVEVFDGHIERVGTGVRSEGSSRLAALRAARFSITDFSTQAIALFPGHAALEDFAAVSEVLAASPIPALMVATNQFEPSRTELIRFSLRVRDGVALDLGRGCFARLREGEIVEAEVGLQFGDAEPQLELDGSVAFRRTVQALKGP